VNKHIKEIIILALSTSILIVQELAFSFLPNIQLTTFLVMVYVRAFGIKKSSMIVLVYVFVDNLIFGSLMMLNIVLPMLIGWFFIIYSFYFVSKMSHKLWVYVVLAYLFGHIYGLIYAPFQVWILKVEMIPYLIVDLPWQVIMGLSNALSVLWLYEPLSQFLVKLNDDFNHQNKEEPVKK
jgi:hypothetical protein